MVVVKDNTSYIVLFNRRAPTHTHMHTNTTFHIDTQTQLFTLTHTHRHRKSLLSPTQVWLHGRVQIRLQTWGLICVWLQAGSLGQGDTGGVDEWRVCNLWVSLQARPLICIIIGPVSYPMNANGSVTRHHSFTRHCSFPFSLSLSPSLFLLLLSLHLNSNVVHQWEPVPSYWSDSKHQWMITQKKD